MREIGPTYYFAPPRVLEALLTQVTIRMEDASALKRAHVPPLHGRRAARRRADPRRQPVGACDRLLYCAGRAGSSTAPLRNVLGMSRVRVAYTAGEAIGPDLFTLLPLARHQPEAALRLDRDQRVRLRAAERPGQAGHRRPAGEGRGDQARPSRRDPDPLAGPVQGVLQEPEATREAKDAEGWFHTGDAGYFDADGHLKIIDRAKDVGKLADGSLFAPKYLENKLKFFPYIKEAVAFGARPRQGLRLHQHRHGGGRQLGRAAQPALRRLHRPRRASPR